MTGRAGGVQKNLLNLLPITEKSIVLPLPSYSLNQVSTPAVAGGRAATAAQNEAEVLTFEKSYLVLC